MTQLNVCLYVCGSTGGVTDGCEVCVQHMCHSVCPERVCIDARLANAQARFRQQLSVCKVIYKSHPRVALPRTSQALRVTSPVQNT